MKVSIDSELVIEGVRMDALRLPLLVQALGADRTEENIPLHGGGTRKRESWGSTGVTSLRDEEEEAICLFVDASRAEIAVDGRELPRRESDFLRSFPSAEKQIGHVYSLHYGPWWLQFDFPPSKKRRGVGSSIRHLSRLVIGHQKAANQPPEPTSPFGRRGSS